MTYQVIVTERAETELHETARWYEARCPGIGMALLAKFEITVTQIQHYPESFERIDSIFRRAVLGRFPYFVVYRVVSGTIRILRVMPERGDPQDMPRK